MPGLARPPGVGSIVIAGPIVTTIAAGTAATTVSAAATVATSTATTESTTETTTSSVRTSDYAIMTLIVHRRYFRLRRVCRTGPIGTHCLSLALYTRNRHHRRLAGLDWRDS